MRDGDRQDELERRWLGVFLSNCDDAPAEVPRRPASQRPDFIVDTVSGVLGIELTFLFRETGVEHHGLQAQEARRERVLAAAAETIGRRLGALPSVRASIFWLQRLLVKEDEGPLALAIAEAVVSALPRGELPAEAMEWIIGWDDMGEVLLQDSIDEIVLHGLPPGVGFHWSAPWARWLTPDLPDLAARVGEKETKLDAYLRECSRCWLVIVAGTAGPASWLQRPEDLRASQFRSRFERIYLVDGFSAGRCSRLG